jgi:Na+-translocating ferredoxin:NAD+ oxidoreductase RnfD subunit
MPPTLTHTADTTTTATDAALPATPYLRSPEPQVDPITHSPLHAGVDVGRYYVLHMVAACFPAATGVILYGWRSLGVIAAVTGSALLAGLLWQRIGTRGGGLRLVHVGWFGLLLSLMLPAHLAARYDAAGYSMPWPILVAAGFTLAPLMWLLGGLGAGRVHPVLVCYLLLAGLYGNALTANRVLQRGHLITGDLFAAPRPDQLPPSSEPWIHAAPPGGGEALWRDNTAERLSNFTTGVEANDPRMWLGLDVLLRDRMPPLEDLIVGGEPGPIGAGCALGVIVGGLFLLYRGLIDYRIPVAVLLTAYGTMLLLPIPVSLVNDVPQYSWLPLRTPQITWQTALTFVHYELLSGPAVFIALFLATSPSIRPITKPARLLYAIVAGVLTAIFQFRVSVTYGPYAALLIASLLTPWFDKLMKPRPLV